MSTWLSDKGTHWEIATVTGFGSRKKLPRHLERVEKGDKAALIEAMTRKADNARREAGVDVPALKPVD